jgi:hypothetical protein
MMSDDKNCNETKVNRIKQLINLSHVKWKNYCYIFFYVTQNAIILYMALSFNLFLTACVPTSNLDLLLFTSSGLTKISDLHHTMQNKRKSREQQFMLLWKRLVK